MEFAIVHSTRHFTTSNVIFCLFCYVNMRGSVRAYVLKWSFGQVRVGTHCTRYTQPLHAVRFTVRVTVTSLPCRDVFRSNLKNKVIPSLDKSGCVALFRSASLHCVHARLVHDATTFIPNLQCHYGEILNDMYNSIHDRTRGRWPMRL